MTTFKRGDGVVFVRTAHRHVIGQPTEEYQDITVGMVTSVTRAGQIKAYRHAAWGRVVRLDTSLQRHALAYVLPKDEIDVAGVLDYCANRPWSHAPEHKGMPFHSLDEVKAELRQFKCAPT